MLAAAIGIDRAVETDVGRLVEAEDGLRMLHRDGGAQLRRRAVERAHMVQPVAIGLACGEAETLRHCGRLRAAPVKRGLGGGVHVAEHSMNIDPVTGGFWGSLPS